MQNIVYFATYFNMKKLLFIFYILFIFFEACNSKRVITLDLFKNKIENCKTIILPPSFKKNLKKVYFKNTYFLNDSLISGLDYMNQEILTFSIYNNDTSLNNKLKLNNLSIEKFSKLNDTLFMLININKIDAQEIAFQNSKFKLHQQKIKLFTFNDSTISIDKNNLFINFNEQFYKIYNYQLNKVDKEPNYVDSSAFLVIGKNTKKLGEYSKKYYNKILDIRSLNFDFIDSTIYYIGALDESLKYVNIVNKSTFTRIVHKDERLNYPKSKLTDLSYSRIYRATIELNVDLKICKNKYIVLLKRLPKSDFFEKEKYKYFVFDKKLNAIFADTIPEPILPNIYPTRMGFRLINDSATKLFDYEF